MFFLWNLWFGTVCFACFLRCWYTCAGWNGMMKRRNTQCVSVEEKSYIVFKQTNKQKAIISVWESPKLQLVKSQKIILENIIRLCLTSETGQCWKWSKIHMQRKFRTSKKLRYWHQVNSWRENSVTDWNLLIPWAVS